MNPDTSRLMDTECNRDYNKKHRFEKIGVDHGSIIYQCSQCNRCVRDTIIYIYDE